MCYNTGRRSAITHLPDTELRMVNKHSGSPALWNDQFAAETLKYHHKLDFGDGQIQAAAASRLRRCTKGCKDFGQTGTHSPVADRGEPDCPRLRNIRWPKAARTAVADWPRPLGNPRHFGTSRWCDCLDGSRERTCRDGREETAAARSRSAEELKKCHMAATPADQKIDSPDKLHHRNMAEKPRTDFGWQLQTRTARCLVAELRDSSPPENRCCRRRSMSRPRRETEIGAATLDPRRCVPRHRSRLVDGSAGPAEERSC